MKQALLHSRQRTEQSQRAPPTRSGAGSSSWTLTAIDPLTAVPVQRPSSFVKKIGEPSSFAIFPIFYFAKTTIQPPSQLPHSAVGKAPRLRSQGHGLDPGSDHRFLRIFYFFLFQRKSTCVLFRSQKQPTNLLLYLAWGGQKQIKISPRGPA